MKKTLFFLLATTMLCTTSLMAQSNNVSNSGSGNKAGAANAANSYKALIDQYSSLSPAEMMQEAKSMRQTYDMPKRCAGIYLQLKADPANATKTALAVLKTGMKPERQVVLEHASELCGSDFKAAVVKSFSKFVPAAQVDVVRWYGDNNVAEGMANITKSIQKGSKDLVLASLNAASKIGGEQALQAITSQIETQYGNEAAAALRGFNGDVSTSVVAALSSANKQTVVNMLEVADARQVHSAYSKVKELCKSSDSGISTAAQKALGGVATAENFGELCSMLEQAGSGSSAILQQSTMRAIEKEAGNKQFDLASKAMQRSQNRQLYYPIIAQSATDNAIATLQNENNSKANEAMLNLQNIKMLPILFEAAKQKQEGTERDNILSHYIDIASKAKMTPEELYIRLFMLDQLNPGKEQRNAMFAAMGQKPTVQALSYMRGYYDADGFYETIAQSVKNILRSDADLNGGKNVRVMLEIAKSVYGRKLILDSSAEADFDQVTALIDNHKDKGYSLSTEIINAGKNGFWNTTEEFEDFDMSFDWCTGGVLTVTLRSMPILILDNQRGAQIAGSSEWKHYDSLGDWNTTNIKVAGDRLTVSVNGHELFTKVLMTNPEAGQPLVKRGTVGLEVRGDQLIISHRRMRHL